ncbi:MAG: monovalent cation/H+ antiporter complex subunit F [Firmicutes bacterium]|jgi:multisubunit Na+/H+ antiporter MnhF subunit|nr:monovalent cation/H+ antiporter complex subunit F [Bacillota bacterium]
MIFYITMFLISLALIILMIKLIRVETIWEKITIMNLMAIKIIMLITVYSVFLNSYELLDISLTYSIIGFLSVAILSRFIIGGGRLK